MRKMMIAGGTIGFGIGTVLGLATDGTTWPVILLRASVGALVVGLLLRWWARLWNACWLQAQAEHQAAPEKP
jgi:hypothetical protein